MRESKRAYPKLTALFFGLSVLLPVLFWTVPGLSATVNLTLFLSTLVTIMATFIVGDIRVTPGAGASQAKVNDPTACAAAATPDSPQSFNKPLGKPVVSTQGELEIEMTPVLTEQAQNGIVH